MTIENKYQKFYFDLILNFEFFQMIRIGGLIADRNYGDFVCLVAEESQRLRLIRDQFQKEIHYNLEQYESKETRFAYFKRIYQKLKDIKDCIDRNLTSVKYELGPQFDLTEDERNSSQTLEQKVRRITKEHENDSKAYTIWRHGIGSTSVTIPPSWARYYLEHSLIDVSCLLIFVQKNARVDGYFLKDLNEDIKSFVSENKSETINPADPHQTENAVRLVFKNNFNNVSEEVVYNYFKKELVDKKHLSDPHLMDYLNLAFDKMQMPKIRFTINNLITIKRTTETFYKFYKEISGKPNGKKEQYAALLGEYFEGFKTKTVANNFSK